jgi:hypothetical protein
MAIKIMSVHWPLHKRLFHRRIELLSVGRQGSYHQLLEMNFFSGPVHVDNVRRCAAASHCVRPLVHEADLKQHRVHLPLT